MANTTCSVLEDGKLCGRPVKARGMCKMHYQRWMRRGDTQPGKRGTAGERHHLWRGADADPVAMLCHMRRNHPPVGVCEECGKATRTMYALKAGLQYSRARDDYRELCPRCHIRYRRGLAPAASLVPVPAPGLPVICMRGATWQLWPCKIWTGPLIEAGYGRRYKRGSSSMFVHRQALEEGLGRPIGPGLLALHHCDVRSCYEPAHLYEGTQADNMRDCRERGRRRNPYDRPPLTLEEEAEIRDRYGAGHVTYAELAAVFGVRNTTIGRVVNYR